MKGKPKSNSTKGNELEKLAEIFFRRIFEEMKFLVIECRKQKSGTQNGFDLKIEFCDENEVPKCFFIECKNYETSLNWSELTQKIWELEASNYSVDGFIAISPHQNISNIDHNIYANAPGKFKFPIKLWTPDHGISEIFSIDKDIYKKIYGVDCPKCDRKEVLKKVRTNIINIVKEKSALNIWNKVEIKKSEKKPVEDGQFVTNLDLKLDAVLDKDDIERIEYHQFRCDYKIFLESLEDINNSLRLKILNWQDNLRLKAKRLSKNFQLDDQYTPQKFFHDFFNEAEQELIRFYLSEKLDGDKEKLLHGVIFELAAECPLDWRKYDTIN